MNEKSFWVMFLCAAFVFPKLFIFEPAARIFVLLVLYRAGFTKITILIGIAWLVPAYLSGSAWLSSGVLSYLEASSGRVRNPPLSLFGESVLALTDFAAILALLSLQSARKVAVMAIALALFLVWAHISAAISPSPVIALGGLGTWRVWILAFQVSFLLLAGYEKLTVALISSAALVALIGLFQFLIGDFSYVLDAPRFDDYLYRVRSTYHRHNSLALALGITLLIALPFWRNFKTGIGIILIVALLSLNATRAVSLSIIFGVSVYFAWRTFLMRRMDAWPAIAIILVFALTIQLDKREAGIAGAYGGVVTMGESIPPEGSDSVFGQALDDRTLLLRLGVASVQSNPVFGSGVDQISLPLSGDRFSGSTRESSSHSLWLDIAAQAGIPAVIFLLIGVVALLKIYLSSNHAAIGLGLLAYFGLAGFFFVEQVDHTIMILFAWFGASVKS